MVWRRRGRGWRVIGPRASAHLRKQTTMRMRSRHCTGTGTCMWKQRTRTRDRGLRHCTGTGTCSWNQTALWSRRSTRSRTISRYVCTRKPLYSWFFLERSNIPDLCTFAYLDHRLGLRRSGLCNASARVFLLATRPPIIRFRVTCNCANRLFLSHTVQITEIQQITFCKEGSI